MFLGVTPKQALHLSVVDLLGAELVHDLRNAAGLSSIKTMRERIGSFKLANKFFEVAASLAGEHLLIELEPLEVLTERVTTPVARVRRLMARLQRSSDLQSLLEAATRGLWEITGFDRVMAYRFLPNDEGEVVAESVSAGVDSFLGLRYPASDIPAQARLLYLRSPLRMLVDVQAESVPLHALPGAASLDMSFIHCRAMSPVHLQYLRNMGVSASLSISIVVAGKLWGLFAFHHYRPKLLSPDLRSTLELLGELFSAFVPVQLERDRLITQQHVQQTLTALLNSTASASTLIEQFPQIAPLLADLMRADGVVLFNALGVAAHWGVIPPTVVIATVAAHYQTQIETIDHTNSLKSLDGANPHCAGVLIIKPIAEQFLQLHFYRRELLQQVRWAGKPEKNFQVLGGEINLMPRTSFAEYLDSVQAHCQPWSQTDYATAKAVQLAWLHLLARSEAETRERIDLLNTHQNQQKVLLAELGHRVKNILALIRSLVRQARHASVSVDEYAQALEQRIAALAAAHDLVAQNTSASADLHTLVELELGPHRNHQSNNIFIHGQHISLRADAVPTLILVIHELVTNATKYGALSTARGNVWLRWWRENEGLSIEWLEQDGPKVVPPKRRGFGTQLIERAMSYELDGKTDLQFEPYGLLFHCWIPEVWFSSVANDIKVKVVPEIATAPLLPQETSQVLVVEDNMLLAADLEEVLKQAGCSKVVCAPSCAAAFQALKQHRFNAAFLDVHVRGEKIFPVAEQLAQQNIPFVFTTGYGMHLNAPASLAHYPVLAKPLEQSKVLQALQQML